MQPSNTLGDRAQRSSQQIDTGSLRPLLHQGQSHFEAVSPICTGAKIGPDIKQHLLRACCSAVVARGWPGLVSFRINRRYHHCRAIRMQAVSQPEEASRTLESTFTGSWASVTAHWGNAETTDVSLPTNKLSESVTSDTEQQPVVLLNCGSFNPPTIMHLRMLEVAAQALRKEGYAVVGGYISPVNDAYKKPGLLSSQHRIKMCQLAATESDLVMVDTWEAAQAEAQRSLIVLKRIQHAAQKYYKDNAADTDAQQGEGWQQDDQSRMNSGSKAASSDINAHSKPRRHIGTQVKSVLVCGADVLESFIKPGVWVEDQVRQILGDHGVVCIARDSTKLEQLLHDSGTLLSEYKQNIFIAKDPATAGISSTIIRQEIAKGNSVKFLTTNDVISYICEHRLYTQQ